MSIQQTKEWDTRSLFLTTQYAPAHSGVKNAIIVVNTPQVHDPLFSDMLDSDGGANRFYDWMRSNQKKPLNGYTGLLPDTITGDFDSIRPQVKEYFESRGVLTVHDPDEYATDLNKCVKEIVKFETQAAAAVVAAATTKNQISPKGRIKEEEDLLKAEQQQQQQQQQQHQIIISGGLTGRLDQTMHTLHAMRIISESRQQHVWAIGAESLACILTKGKHALKIDLDRFGKTCGILPLFGSAQVLTTGLEWNLGPFPDHMYPTSFYEKGGGGGGGGGKGGEISTSNHIVSEMVTIQTDIPVVWTMEVKATVTTLS